MEAVGNGLKFIFTYVLYPGILLGLFVSISMLIYKIVMDAKDNYERIRRIAAAALPVISLVFLIIVGNSKDSANLKEFMQSLGNFFKFLLGFIIGVDIIEAGRYFLKSKEELWLSIYAIFLSSVLSFFLYMFMLGGLGSLQFLLFGIVSAGIVLIIFRGLPGIKEPGLSKSSMVFLLILNLTFLTATIFLSDWVFKPEAVDSTPQAVTTRPSAVQKPIKQESPPLNEKEKAYIKLLKTAIESENWSEFKRCVKELKAMGSYHKIPIPLIIDALRKVYHYANESSYYSSHTEASIEAINFFRKMKAKEACALLSQIQAEGGYLYEHAKNATKEICGY